MKRYDPLCGDQDLMREDQAGAWVRYEDAAYHNAERERMVDCYSKQLIETSRMERDWMAAEDELKALRETLKCREVAAEYSRRQCDAAEAKVRMMEMDLERARNLLGRWLPYGRAWIGPAKFSEGDVYEVGSICGATSEMLEGK